ncbi:MAG: allene oxide cyclase barrel-like domain-containing protein [Egibacteraceae bacterium]
MRHSRKTVVGTAAVIVGMLSMFSVSAAEATTGTEKLEIQSRTVESVDIDVDGNGKFSQGDQSIFADRLIQDGKHVGTSGGVCTVTRAASKKDSTFHCVVTFDLPKGQITTQGLIDAEKKEFKEAITGGTGAYKNAGGEVLVKLVSKGADLTFFIDNLG